MWVLIDLVQWTWKVLKWKDGESAGELEQIFLPEPEPDE